MAAKIKAFFVHKNRVYLTILENDAVRQAECPLDWFNVRKLIRFDNKPSYSVVLSWPPPLKPTGLESAIESDALLHVVVSEECSDGKDSV